MKIPKSFKLAGQTIRVQFESKIRGSKRDNGSEVEVIGLAEYDANRIRLQKTAGGKIMPQDKIEQAFMHELIHHLLSVMGENKLSGNEKFVDTFASLLHQALTTMEYETKKK